LGQKSKGWVQIEIFKLEQNQNFGWKYCKQNAGSKIYVEFVLGWCTSDGWILGLGWVYGDVRNWVHYRICFFSHLDTGFAENAILNCILGFHISTIVLWRHVGLFRCKYCILDLLSDLSTCSWTSCDFVCLTMLESTPMKKWVCMLLTQLPYLELLTCTVPVSIRKFDIVE
jgi:hypothetical protein